MLRRFRESIRMGGGDGGGGTRTGRGPGGLNWRIIGLVLVVGWILSGVYMVDEGENAVITRFGAYDRTATAGLHMHFPPPFEARTTVNVTEQRSHEIGCATRGEECVDRPDESLMITGDRNIVQVHFRVYYVINDTRAFVFNVDDPVAAVRAVAESSMREVIGRRQLEAIITRERAQVEQSVLELMQQVLAGYESGVRIVQVQLLAAAAPPAVIDAFDDVVRAGQNAEEARNVAMRHRNEVVPAARGAAAAMVQQAEAYRERVVREASGEAERFNSIYAQYRANPRVTRDRLYTETMERVYRDADTVILDQRGGAVPYLPLDGMLRRDRGGAQAPA
ncbi:MAG: FtsH protease activity modulator HflK, partial [Hyphomonadaceae bacterium]|nr:FtsH protease activity modulator HflK [Hyphomonadaceae bacterium]